MKKPIKTTLDVDVLAELKSRAEQKKCHVNDIIEDLVMDQLHREYFSRNDKDIPTMDYSQKEAYLCRKLKQVIDDTLDDFSLGNFDPPDTLELIAQLIAKLALSKERWDQWLKNE